MPIKGNPFLEQDNQAKLCPWCYNHKGKSELQFTIIDDDCGQYVTKKLIRFCPFCGKELKERKGNGNNI